MYMNDAKTSRTSSRSMAPSVPDAIMTKFVNVGSSDLRAKAPTIREAQIISDGDKEIRLFTVGDYHVAFKDQLYERLYRFLCIDWMSSFTM